MGRRDQRIDGRVHYFLDSTQPGMPSFGGGPGSKSESEKILDWVEQHYTSTTVDGVVLYYLAVPAH